MRVRYSEVGTIKGAEMHNCTHLRVHSFGELFSDCLSETSPRADEKRDRKTTQVKERTLNNLQTFMFRI